MKKSLLYAVVIGLLGFGLQAKDLKVLMVGNSFSQSVLAQLPEMVRAEKRHNLVLAQLNIGGCSLERHIQELKKAQDNPEYKPYYTNHLKKGHVNLPEMITAEKWDIVTIQQSSTFSWQPEKTQPFADELIAYIRKHAPLAEIVIQQTWSCRVPMAETKELSRRYEILRKNYATLAAKHGLRIIPMGDAVQIFRNRFPVTVKTVDTSIYKYPQRPPFSGEPAWGYVWRKNKTNNQFELRIDAAHLTPEGEYLQACVWYGALFGENPSEIKYAPKNMDSKLAEAFRSCAAEALGRKK